MSCYPNRSARRGGFTLVELLTVVGIIALLISILIPSLAQARRQAKRTASAATIGTLDRGLEMFHNDFDEYPDSSFRPDPIKGLPADPQANNCDAMMGAHWLARAMFGPDLRGMDPGGLSLKDIRGSMLQTDYAMLPPQRKGLYVESDKVLLRDNDATLRSPPPSMPTYRPFVVDTFKRPILYYRANARAQFPFSVSGSGTGKPGSSSDKLGVYNQLDNALITGSDKMSVPHWDFASTGLRHGIGEFGGDYVADLDKLHQPVTELARGLTFVEYLHNHKAHEMGAAARPVNPEKYVLISAGYDGLYGTDDDVANFER